MSFRRLAGQSLQWVRRPEGLVLFTALAAVLALFAFIMITEEMLEGDTRDFDEWLLRSLRHPRQPEVPIGPQWLIEAARDITVLGGGTVLVGGGLLSSAMKHLIGRARPEIVPHFVPVASPSFPSGHSMLAAVVYLTLGEPGVLGRPLSH